MAKAKRRDNHSGRLELRGSKWLAIWSVGGKRFSRSTGETDRAKAEAWLARQLEAVKVADGMRQLDKDRDTIQQLQRTVLKTALADNDARKAALEAEADKSALRIDDAMAAYIAAPNREDCTPQTLGFVRAKFSRLRAWLAERHPEITEMRQVDKNIAREFAASLRGQLGASAYNGTLIACKRIWHILGDLIKGDGNPWTRDVLPRRRLGQTVRREFTAEELNIIFDLARKEVPPLEELFCVMLYTGLRIGDAAQLMWDDIDLARGMISVIPQKTKRFGKRVKIPLLPPLRKMLEAHTERKGLVMPDMAKLYRRGQLSARVSAFLRKCGLTTSEATTEGRGTRPILTAHSFRHTFVSLAGNAGIPFALVQRIVGHSSERMSEHYFHESDDALARAFTAFPVIADKPALAAPDDAIEAEATVVPLAGKSRLDALSDALRAIVANGDAEELQAARQAVADILA